MGINRVYITGNLTRDAEQRGAASGANVLAFCVAVNDRRKNQQTGEWEDYPNYVDCIMFGNRVPYFADKLTRGTKVAVDGKLRYSSWEKDGQKRSKLEVIAEDVETLAKAEPKPAMSSDDLPF